MDKKGVSPVIATVLLIGVVIALSIIVFFWFKSFTQETITKFGGQNIQLSCGDVTFDARYSSGSLEISDTGNIPIYNFNLQISTGGGSYSTQAITDITTTWPSVGLNQGTAYSGDISSAVSGAKSIILIPVLRGVTSSGQEKVYVCGSQYGKTISL